MIFASLLSIVGYALAGAACVGVGVGVHVLLNHLLDRIARDKARAFLEEKSAIARSRFGEAQRHALDEATRFRDAAMGELEEDRETLDEFHRRLQDRSVDLDARDARIDESSAELEGLQGEARAHEGELRGIRRRIGRVRAEGRRILHEVIEKSEEDLRLEFLNRLDGEVSREMTRHLDGQFQLLEEEAEGRAHVIVDGVVQRMQMSHAREDRPAAVEFGDVARLEKAALGAESPSLAAFQEASGVEVSIDDEAATMSLNAMDGVRREIARRAMIQLLGLEVSATSAASGDGESRRRGRSGEKRGGEKRGSEKRRSGGGKSAAKNRSGSAAERPVTPCTPERVQQVLERTEREVRRSLNRKGRKAAQQLKLPGNNKLFEYLGRLNYRTSYGQNILKHSQEVGFLGGMLGAEAGFDMKVAKRCAFLHDIGKCIDYEIEGGHPEIGGRLARECGEDEVVVNAVESHHDDVPQTTLYPLLVQAADAISGARPGARRRTAEKYLIRMGQIEEIALNKPGVESAYVVQAGREVRVILDADSTNDADAASVADAIARELEVEMNFPGKIKVTVVREKRLSAIAR